MSTVPSVTICPRCQLSFQPGAPHVHESDTGDATQTRVPPSASSNSVAPASGDIPTRLGRFEIKRFLGEGVFGRVFEAYDSSLKRMVALKVAKADQMTTVDRVQRFQREARAAATLAHPHIVGVFDAGQDGPHHYIATTFIEGRSLAALLEDQPNQPLPVRRCAEIVRRLAEALAYAHKNGVIHRDVKPGNVLINEQDEPLLADFGLALRADDVRQTTKGQGLGTPAYMAPEQWRGESVAASDQYSLGCLLFELLTGQLPFTGRDEAHHMFLHLNEPAPSPRRFQASVPLDVETICLKTLEKEPARRYATCQELADDLRRWLEGEPIQTRRIGPMERVIRWAKKNPLVAGLATVFVLLTVGVSLSSYLAYRADQALSKEKDERARRALAQVEALLTASPQAVPALLENLADQRDDVLPRLREIWEEPQTGTNRSRRMRAALALLPEEPDKVREPLVTWMLEVPDPAELLVIRGALQPHAEELREPLWQQLKHPDTTQAKRLRLLAALAGFDPKAEAWKEAGGQALEAWLADNPLYLGVWTDALRPVRDSLLVPLTEVYQGKRLQERRAVVASILADYLSDLPDTLADRLMDAEATQFAPLFEVLQKQHRERAIPLLTKETQRIADAKASEADRETLARRQANAGLALMKLKEQEPVWPFLKHSPYPEARSRLIKEMAPGGVEVTTLVQRLEMEKEVSTRRALILALGEFTEQQVPTNLRQRVSDKLVKWYREDPDAGLHGAIDWLLRHDKEGPEKRKLNWGRRKDLEQIDAELAAQSRRWRVALTAGRVGLSAGGRWRR